MLLQPVCKQVGPALYFPAGHAGVASYPFVQVVPADEDGLPVRLIYGKLPRSRQFVDVTFRHLEVVGHLVDGQELLRRVGYFLHPFQVRQQFVQRAEPLQVVVHSQYLFLKILQRVLFEERFQPFYACKQQVYLFSVHIVSSFVQAVGSAVCTWFFIAHSHSSRRLKYTNLPLGL